MTEHEAQNLSGGKKPLLGVARLLVVLIPMVLGLGSVAKTRAQGEPESANGDLPKFDVVSVKPGKPSCVSLGIGGFSPGDFQAACIPLKGIIAYAYGYDTLHDERVFGGPNWIDSTNFDIEAKVNASDLNAYSKLKRPEYGLMLQQVLTERFDLKAHRETRDLPVYALVIANGGSKLKEARPGEPSHAPAGIPANLPGGMLMRQRGKLVAWNSPLQPLTSYLRNEMGQTVIDETGLAGNYDFTLEWTPETTVATEAAATESAKPSILTALQEQLGLKLVSRKEPQEVLVIDHIERPSPN